MTPPGGRDHAVQRQPGRPLTAPANSAVAKERPPAVTTPDRRYRYTHRTSPDTQLRTTCPPADRRWPRYARGTRLSIVAGVYYPDRGDGWRPSWRVGRRWVPTSPAEDTGVRTRVGSRAHHYW